MVPDHVASEMLELCKTLPKLKNRMLKRLAGPDAPRHTYKTKGGYTAQFLCTPVPSMRVTGRNEKEKRLMELVREQIEFEFLQLNGPNLVCARHRDKKNRSTSKILFLGSFRGGALLVEEDEETVRFDKTNQWFSFDGARCWHWNEPVLEGEKYAIVAY